MANWNADDRTLSGVLTATASYPFDADDRAALGLRRQLRLQAIDKRLRADWDTFMVTGPARARGAYGVVWNTWTGTVETRP